MRDLVKRAVACETYTVTAARRAIEAADDPDTRSEGDVAVLLESPSFHNPEAIGDWDDVAWVAREVAGRAGLTHCPHCDPDARRATITAGPGGGSA